MKKSDILNNLSKAKDKIVEVSTNVGETVIEKGKQIKDSDTVDKITQSAKNSAEKVRSTVEEMSKQTIIIDNHSVLRFRGTKVKLLIPDAYEQITDKKMISELQDIYGLKKKIEATYMSQTPNSFNMVSFFYPDKNRVMEFGNIEGLISGIHESLGENQGLIEVKSGKTKRGYDFIYSIVKTVGHGPEMPHGVVYFLRMNIGFEDKIIEVYGNFEEQGTTGIRESMAACFAHDSGVCKMGSESWCEDPYDKEYKKGIRKNYAEKEGLDGLFPDNPLSQAHEFILAIINDELVIMKEDSTNKDTSDSDKNEAMSNEEEQVESKRLLAGLFVDECRRHTITIDIDPVNTDENNDSDNKNEKEKLDEKLRMVIDEYNAAYTLMNDKGTNLYIQRERSIDLIKNVENLVNSIANHPKEFDTTISEIITMRQDFTNACEYAKQTLEAAQKSAIGAGAGVAGGAAVAALAPSAAMWVATTFGTASTGTAISALSGAAAQNAALAWLGGGAVVAGGHGMAGGIKEIHSPDPVADRRSDCQHGVESQHPEHRLEEPWRQLVAVRLQSRHFRIVQEASFADMQQRQNQQHKEDDSHAAKPIEQTPPEEQSLWQPLNAIGQHCAIPQNQFRGNDTCPRGGQSRSRLKKRIRDGHPGNPAEGHRPQGRPHKPGQCDGSESLTHARAELHLLAMAACDAKEQTSQKKGRQCAEGQMIPHPGRIRSDARHHGGNPHAYAEKQHQKRNQMDDDS